MIVDLTEKEEAGTFDLKGGGKVHLRLLNAKDLKAMRKACVKVVAEYPLIEGKHQRFEAQQVDSDLWDTMLHDRTITGWDGLFDKNEKPIPVTPENKVLLMEREPVFREAVEAGLKALKEAETERVQAAEKN